VKPLQNSSKRIPPPIRIVSPDILAAMQTNGQIQLLSRMLPLSISSFRVVHYTSHRKVQCFENLLTTSIYIFKSQDIFAGQDRSSAYISLILIFGALYIPAVSRQYAINAGKALSCRPMAQLKVTIGGRPRTTSCSTYKAHLETYLLNLIALTLSGRGKNRLLVSF
jgi:hypothetical protein